MITALFRFFASLKLAIFLLLALALVFAVGTFMESAYGAEAAKLLVYDTPWLSLLLLALALNVAASALDRFPWQKRHVGFVVTHCGIILMLAGSLVTRAFGIEGQMAIEEGQTQSRMILSQPVVEFFSGPHGGSNSLFLKPQAFAWQGREKLHTNPDLWLLHYYPKARREEILRESSSGPAALEVSLTSSFTSVRQTLVLDDPEKSRVNLGPAELSFGRDPLVVSPLKGAPQQDVLEFRFENSSIQLPLPKILPKKISLKGTPYEVTILRILKDAVVDDQKNELVDRSGEWNNPACELILKGKGIEEKHMVFSKYPDFQTLHGMKPSEAGVRIFFHRPGEEPSGAKNELRFVWQEDSLPRYQIRSGDKITEGVIPVGEEVPLGWMDFKFRVENYYPHAEQSASFTALPAGSRSEEHPSALELEIENGGEKKTLWLAQGDHQGVRLGDQVYEVVYGLRTLPVGFRLELKDFRVEKYPGTNQPASFESDVIVKDDSTGSVREVNISMNRPLKHRGFKVFQSGYQLPENSPEISVFSVAKDPGIPIKYAGALILVGGTLLMFYTRKFSNREQNNEKGDSPLKRGQSPFSVGSPLAGARHAGSLIMLLGLILFAGFSSNPGKSAEEILGKIPVQSGGRVKPFESFAQEILVSVTGKKALAGEKAAIVLWKWISDPEAWHTKSFIPVKHKALREEFGLMVFGGKISPELILSHPPFLEKVEEATVRKERKEPITLLEKKRIELADRAHLFQALARGVLPGFIPNPEDPRESWFPIEALATPGGQAALGKYYLPELVSEVHTALGELVRLLHDGKEAASAAHEFSFSLEHLRSSREIVLDQEKINLELLYNHLRPFHWAWILYLASAFLLSLRVPVSLLAMTLWFSGFAVHTFGFALRSLVAGRPPVSNMYESIVWVAWAVAFFSIPLRYFSKKPLVSVVAALVASLALLIGESFPAVLDPSLSPLVPVLRSNYWLTIHVLTITLSYGAFALAWGLAHANLFNFAFHPEKRGEQDSLGEFLYRALQIGVVLLAAGTILGGVWANDSWGRFWGWDPKETWALIALLGYLAILHCRQMRWIGTFGTAVGSVFAFLGILMAWYGVNFVLAAGLHSYGFGGGGFPWVSVGVLIDLALVSFLVFRYHNLRSGQLGQAAIGRSIRQTRSDRSSLPV